MLSVVHIYDMRRRRRQRVLVHIPFSSLWLPHARFTRHYSSPARSSTWTALRIIVKKRNTDTNYGWTEICFSRWSATKWSSTSPTGCPTWWWTSVEKCVRLYAPRVYKRQYCRRRRDTVVSHVSHMLSCRNRPKTVAVYTISFRYNV